MADALVLLLPAVLLFSSLWLLSALFPAKQRELINAPKLRNEFVAHPPLNSRPWVHRGLLRGWYNFASLLILTYYIRHVYVMLRTTGSVFSPAAVNYLLRVFLWEGGDFVIVVLAEYLALYYAFIIQWIMAQCNLGQGYRTMLGWTQHVWMMGMLFMACKHALDGKELKSLSFRFATVAQCCVMCMKMHSYLLANAHLWRSKKEANPTAIDSTNKSLSEVMTLLKARGVDEQLIAEHESNKEVRAREILKEIEKMDALRATVYPENVNLKNFFRFSVMPVLVYEPRYPTRDTISVGYLMQKLCEIVGLITLLWLVLEYHIHPSVRSLASGQLNDPVLIITEMIAPVSCFFVLLFFIVFDCILPALAEVSGLADRGFYSDWWNSTMFEEFSRKWNKPVHEYLLRHVYAESLYSLNLSKRNAAIFTFLVSIVIHEVIVIAITGIFRPYLAFFSLLQIPLQTVMRSSLFQGKRLGNIAFWTGIICGLPLIVSLYFKDYCATPGRCDFIA